MIIHEYFNVQVGRLSLTEYQNVLELKVDDHLTICIRDIELSPAFHPTVVIDLNASNTAHAHVSFEVYITTQKKILI